MAKKITLEKLAQMVQRGFSETATKGDLAKLGEYVRTLEKRIESFEKNMDYGFDQLSQSLKGIKEELVSLDQSVDVHDLQIRVKRLEKKANLRS